MSSFNNSDSTPTCDATATSRPTLTLTDSPSSLPTDFSMAMLSTELSDSTMIRIGAVFDDEIDATAHSSSPPDFTGRRILVFWQDEPTLYSVMHTSSGCLFSPAGLGATFNATEPAILIDPRGLANPLARIDFTTGTISPDETPEATDGTSKTSHKTPSGQIQHSKPTGGSSGGNGGGKGQRPGGDGAPGSGGKGAGGNRPKNYGGYNDGINNAVDVRSELPQMVIGAVEFLTFFPHHTQWPTIIFRLYRHGWSTGAMAKAMLHARGTLNRIEWDRRQAALRHQLRTATRDRYATAQNRDPTPSSLRQNGHPDFSPFVLHSSGNNVDHYDVRNPMEPSGDVYEPPRGQTTLAQPARLLDVINGVQNWPSDQDRGQLTEALLYAQANGLLQQSTRDLANIVVQQNYTVVTDASTTDWDLRAVERLNNAVANP